MTVLNPLGLHIQREGGMNEEYVRNHVREAQYTTCTVVNASGLAADLQRGGVPYAISRDYNFEPEPKHFTKIEEVREYAIQVYWRYVADVEKSGNENIHVYVNNEQGHDWQRLAMMRFMIEESMKPGNKIIGMVFLNAAPGTLKHGFYGEPNEFASGQMLELLLTFDKYRNVRLSSGAYAFILGVHDYTAYYWWCAVNGGEYRNDTSWDTANKFDSGEYHINWELPQDHLGREYQGIRHALGWSWNDSQRKWIAGAGTLKRPDGTPVEPPYMIVTETILDDMDSKRLIHPGIHLDAGAERARGYHSLETIWTTNWFPGEPAGRVLGKMLDQAWRHVFEPEGYFLGFNYFCFGESGGHRLYTVTLDGNPDMDYFNVVTPYRRNLPDHMFSGEVRIPTPPIIPPVEVPEEEPMPTDPPIPPIPPVEPQMPADDDPRWLRATLTPLKGVVNIRLQPKIVTTPTNVINTLERPYKGWIARDAGMTMTDGKWYPVSLNESDDKAWYPVAVLPLDGWARGDVFKFDLITDVPPPDPEPIPDPEMFIKVTPEQRLALKALLQQIA